MVAEGLYRTPSGWGLSAALKCQVKVVLHETVAKEQWG